MFSYIRYYGLVDKIVEFEHNEELNIINCYIHFRKQTNTDGVVHIHTIGSCHVAQFKDSKLQLFNHNCDGATMCIVVNLMGDIIEELTENN